MLDQLLNAIDTKDTPKFASFLADNCTFRFGNGPEITGTVNIQAFTEQFFESVTALSHEIIDSWDVPGGLVCNGMVTYTRLDSTMLTVPFANFFKIDTSGITEYLIYADTSAL